jgi:quercetin dioxygenase-like cupin family protein
MKIIHYSKPSAKIFPAPHVGVTGRVLIGKADGANNFCMRMIEVAPGGRIAAHKHAWEHEQFVHAGKGRIRKGDGWAEFGPGDALFIPGNMEHEIENIGKDILAIICLVPPSAPEI